MFYTNIIMNKKTNRIGLCSTMSCGKTTLALALSNLPEFKDYKIFTERSKYLMDLGIPLNSDSTINGQTVFLAERVSELIYPNIITDRTLIDVMSFTSAAKSINLNQKNSFDEYAKIFLNQYDYIFYISPEGIPIENNGIREINSEYRDLIDFTIKYKLNIYQHYFNNPVVILKGTTEERIIKIKQTLGL